MSHELTICSVFHSEKNRHLVHLNWKLGNALNPQNRTEWLFADNTPEGTCQEFENASRVRVVRGLAFSSLPNEILPHARGSFHHAMALNSLLPFVTTRFLLILDSDFYIVRPNWMEDTLSHMIQNDLTFFGSVWHPKYYAKYRYFPSVHCMFIDLEKVDKNDLDFRPAAGFRGHEKGETIPKKIYLRRWPWAIRRVAQALTLQDRKFIGSSRDTGYRIYEKFYSQPGTRFECVQPVLHPQSHFGTFARVFYYPNKLFEFFLPDRLRFIPKRKGYVSGKGFRNLGFFDAQGEGWEEYLWKDKPFGIHLRGTKSRIGYDAHTFEKNFLRARQALESFIPSLRVSS